MSISFAGLIRAHGDEGGATTTFDPEQGTTTVATYTTTFDPEVSTETTETTTWTMNVLESIQKHEPIGVNPILQSDHGLIEVWEGGQLIFFCQPMWRVTISHFLDDNVDPNERFAVDCAWDHVTVSIELQIEANGVPVGFAAPWCVPCIHEAFDELMKPGMPIVVNHALSALVIGPQLKIGKTVQAGYGADVGVPGQVGPVVIVCDQFGTVSTSSHGYCLMMKPAVTPDPPSRIVTFGWKTKLGQSKFINIKKHLEARISAKLWQVGNNIFPNGGLDNVQCIIPAIPQADFGAPAYTQQVEAFDMAPTAVGKDCPLMDASLLGQQSEEIPLVEDPPYNEWWNQADPPVDPEIV